MLDVTDRNEYMSNMLHCRIWHSPVAPIAARILPSNEGERGQLAIAKLPNWLCLRPRTHFTESLWAHNWNLVKNSFCCNFFYSRNQVTILHRPHDSWDMSPYYINDIHTWYTHWPHYEPGDCLNDIKVSSCEHRDPHDKDKMILQLSYLYYENPHVWKDSLDIETGPVSYWLWAGHRVLHSKVVVGIAWSIIARSPRIWLFPLKF